jgi:hypothetical protein
MVRLSVPRIILKAFPVADLIHDQDGAACARPKDAQVLKLELSPGPVQAVNDDNSGHLNSTFNRQVEVCGNPNARAAPIDKILPSIASALKLLGHTGLKRSAGGELAERLGKSF